MSTNRMAASFQRPTVPKKRDALTAEITMGQESTASTSNGGEGVSGPWKPGQPIRFDDTHSSKPTNDSAAKAQASLNKAKQAHRRYIAQQRESEREKLERGLPAYSYKTPATRVVSSSARKPSMIEGEASALKAFDPPARAPSLCYTQHLEEANELLECLGPGPLGFDMEWDVTFNRRGEVNEDDAPGKTAVAQICSSNLIVVLHLSAMKGLPSGLVRILKDEKIIKCGVAIRNDSAKFARDFGEQSRNLVELSYAAKATFPQMWEQRNGLIALRDLCRSHLGHRLMKDSVRTSKWSRAPLDKQQVEYAASDSYVGLELLCLFARAIKAREAAEVGKLPGLKPHDVQARVQENVFAALASCSVGVSDEPPPLIVTDPSTSSSSAKPAAVHLPSYRRAFVMWFHEELDVKEIGARMRSKENPLKENTVVGYILRTLEESPDADLSLDNRERLEMALAPKSMDFVWNKHKDLLERLQIERLADSGDEVQGSQGAIIQGESISDLINVSGVTIESQSQSQKL